MKNLISILTISLVMIVSGIKAGNVTPDKETIEMKKEIVRKIDRNVLAMEIMFTKDEIMTKKTLYHRYWVVMMDFRHQLDNEINVKEIERVSEEVKNWNSRMLLLLNQNTEELEWNLSTIMNVNEIKSIVFDIK